MKNYESAISQMETRLIELEGIVTELDNYTAELWNDKNNIKQYAQQMSNHQ